MHKISKKFDFCYGHRVYLQKLTPALSLTNVCKCRHLHGHQAEVEVFLSSSILNQESMVTDFTNLNFFKEFLDTSLDHKFIIDIHDPLYDHLIPLPITLTLDDTKRGKSNRIMTEYGYEIIDLSLYKDYPIHMIEMLESFVIVNFVPTSENLSKWIYEIVSAKLKLYNINVDS